MKSQIFSNKKSNRIVKNDDTVSMIKELALEASNSGQDSKLSNNITQSNILNEHINMDNDDVSDLAENSNTNDNKKSEGNDDIISNEFKEKVITYLKCDDLIRKKMEEIKELKGKKKPCEEFILNYLETKDSSFVKVKDGKLIKNKSESKGSLKSELIKDAILEGIKGEKLEDNDVRTADIAAKIMEIMENKRSKTIRVNLKRTFQRKEK